MFSLAILAIAIFGCMNALLHSIRSKEAQRELITATQAATMKIEEIRSQEFDDVVPMYLTPNDVFDVEGLTHPDTGSKRGRGAIVIDASNPDLLDFEVTIDWVGVRGASTYSTRSMYAR